MSPPGEPAAPSTGDLWRWVDRLTQSRQQRVTRSVPGRQWVEHHEVPSLLELLVEQQATTSSRTSGRGKGGGSRAPLDLATTALLNEIEELLIDGLVSHGVTPHQTVEVVGKVTVHTLDEAASLRALAVVVVGTADPDLIEWWTDRYCTWVLRAEECLDLQADDVTTLPVRGTACPDCGIDTVLVDRDGEDVRQPALCITFRDGQVLHVSCRHCTSSRWRGEGIDTLTDCFAASLDMQLDSELAAELDTEPDADALAGT